MLRSFQLFCTRLSRISTFVQQWLDCADLLLIEEGIGLLIPNGILTVYGALSPHSSSLLLVFDMSPQTFGR